MSIVNGTMQRVMELNERLMDRKIPKPTGTLDTADFPWMAPIEARWQEVAAEVDALIAQQIKLPEVEYVAGFDQGNEGSWTTYTLHTYGTWLEHQCARCPVTTELVRDIPGLQVAGFSVLGPHSHLPRHRGPNRGALRFQIGLRVPGEPGDARIQVGDTLHVWSEGASMVFDHSVHHEAWNDSDGYRYLLFIEFVWPVPGITGAVNRAVQRVFSQAAAGVPDRLEEFDAALNR
ncbi:MAG: aspartyl/asparaginyl beta-hydroxylase domain-containing protein [Acidimicrobiales bacterium]